MSTSNAGLVFCPISSLPELVKKGRIPCLPESLVFDVEVKPGWIHYNPNEVTVLSCNEMFEPIYPVPDIWRTQEHTMKLNTKRDYENLVAMFTKPIIMCVTRRQEDEAMLSRFDIHFIVVFSLSDPAVARELSRISEYVEKHLWKRKNFFLTIDFSERLDEISPLDLNCVFHVTNFHAPNPVLTLDIFYLWCILLPCCIAVALPYRLCRKLRCADEIMDLNAQFYLQATDSVPLALHIFSKRPPPPGRYRTQSHKHSLRACPQTELKTLLYLINC